MALKTSIVLIMISSILPPVRAAIDPHKTPMIRSMKAAINPMDREILAPYHILVNRSRPNHRTETSETGLAADF